mmetsp:Transcript_6427/g.18368  ORF Transcript_6427/g.18368 Transcript_6427/m.18368 type:complete len:291 (-) Transcript_6427:329-1201(-)
MSCHPKSGWEHGMDGGHETGDWSEHLKLRGLQCPLNQNSMFDFRDRSLTIVFRLIGHLGVLVVRARILPLLLLLLRWRSATPSILLRGCGTLLLLLLLPLLLGWMLLRWIGLILLLLLLLPLLLRINTRSWSCPLLLFSHSFFTTPAFLCCLLFCHVSALLFCLLLLLPDGLLLCISLSRSLGFSLASCLFFSGSSSASFVSGCPSSCLLLSCPTTLLLFDCSSVGLFLSSCFQLSSPTASFLNFLLMAFQRCFRFLASLQFLLLSSVFFLSGSYLLLGWCLNCGRSMNG